MDIERMFGQSYLLAMEHLNDSMIIPTIELDDSTTIEQSLLDHRCSRLRCKLIPSEIGIVARVDEVI